MASWAGIVRRVVRSGAAAAALNCRRVFGSPATGAAVDVYAKPRRTGIAHSRFTHGNVFVTIADFAGNTKVCISAGMAGFSGSRRDSKYAANAVAENAARAAFQMGIKSVEVRIKGGFGVSKRKSLLRGFKQGGVNISKIRDMTQVPHNGCRPPKKRRI